MASDDVHTAQRRRRRQRRRHQRVLQHGDGYTSTLFGRYRHTHRHMNTCTHIHIFLGWAWHLVPLGCTSWCSPFFPFELICHPCRRRSRRLVLASVGTPTCFLALTSAGEPTPLRGPWAPLLADVVKPPQPVDQLLGRVLLLLLDFPPLGRGPVRPH